MLASVGRGGSCQQHPLLWPVALLAPQATELLPSGVFPRSADQKGGRAASWEERGLHQPEICLQCSLPLLSHGLEASYFPSLTLGSTSAKWT